MYDKKYGTWYRHQNQRKIDKNLEEKYMKIRKKITDLKEKIQGIDNHLSMNWKHILGDNACIRRTSRGIKIEYRKKKD